MIFKTLNEIKQHQFVGNHASDHEAFSAIELFVHDISNSVPDRAEALRDMGQRGMGFDREEHISDKQLVTDYMAGC